MNHPAYTLLRLRYMIDPEYGVVKQAFLVGTTTEAFRRAIPPELLRAPPAAPGGAPPAAPGGAPSPPSLSSLPSLPSISELTRALGNAASGPINRISESVRGVTGALRENLGGMALGSAFGPALGAIGRGLSQAARSAASAAGIGAAAGLYGVGSTLFPPSPPPRPAINWSMPRTLSGWWNHPVYGNALLGAGIGALGYGLLNSFGRKEKDSGSLLNNLLIGGLLGAGLGGGAGYLYHSGMLNNFFGNRGGAGSTGRR